MMFIEPEKSFRKNNYEKIIMASAQQKA